MLCAGVTTYAALRKSGAQSGEWVVISGAGGGLGHLATQIAAKGMALRVIGVDHGSKEQFVKDCGAEAFLDITKFDDKSIAEEVTKITGGGAAAVIVCTAANGAYAQALGFLKFGGTLVCVGMPEGDSKPIASAYPSVMVTRQLKIVGSAVGNQREAIETLQLAARGLVKTHYRLEKMDKLTEVFEEMDAGKMQGRVVLDLE
jgi:propanol-preferring alcohol dehydrogenase